MVFRKFLFKPILKYLTLAFYLLTKRKISYYTKLPEDTLNSICVWQISPRLYDGEYHE